jgi:hypothetical protein
MVNKKISVTLFLIFTLANILIYLNRDYFLYQPFVDYNSLYKGKNSSPSKWNSFTSKYSESEKIETKRLTDSIIGREKNTIIKAFILANYLHNRFKNQIGKPSYELSGLSPIGQYKLLCSNANEKLWCGTFAEMFSYFCFIQHIPCRYIEIMQPGDHHVVNECYIPETNEWVMMDLTFNMLLIKSNVGTYLNVVSFKNKIKESASGESLFKNQTNLSRNSILHYYNNNYPLYYYNTIEINKVYSFGSKLVRYFLPISWYKIYIDHGKNNILFYSKVAIFLIWLFSCFTFSHALKGMKND